MKTELVLEDIQLEIDGAEGGKVWIFGDDDEMCYIKFPEIAKVVDFLSEIQKIIDQKKREINDK